MAEITRERAGQIVRAIFEVLHRHPEGLRASEAINAAGSRITLTEYELGEYPSAPGKRRFDKIAHSSTVGPTKAGWMVKSKGTWKLTDEGWLAHEQLRDPTEFMREANRHYAAWKRAPPSEVDDLDPTGIAERRAIVDEATELAWSEIVSHLRTMPPCEFHELVASLLRAMGYHAPSIAPHGKDAGVDIVAFTDPRSGPVERIKVRIMPPSIGQVGVADLRAFIDVVDVRDVGLFVALDGFSSDAEVEVSRHEAHRITLLDVAGMFELWVEHYDQLAADARRHLPLRPVQFLDRRQLP